MKSRVNTTQSVHLKAALNQLFQLSFGDNSSLERLVVLLTEDFFFWSTPETQSFSRVSGLIVLIQGKNKEFPEKK